jgi:hypothetical protein
MTIKKTSAVTQSVANTAKRVIVIVGVAIVLGEVLALLALLVIKYNCWRGWLCCSASVELVRIALSV